MHAPLTSLKLYSLQRRRERYRIIYTWKILEGLVPNVGTNKVSSRTSARHGRLCEIPRISNSAPANIRSLLEGSFCIHAGKLFNAIPKSIRNLVGVDIATFKKKLDEFLTSIPDEPQSPGYTARRRADSNSLIHMIPVCTQWLYLWILWTINRVLNVVPQYNVGFYDLYFYEYK